MATATEIPDGAHAGGDPLIDYVRWVLSEGPTIPASVWSGVSFVGDFALAVLHRQDEFQAQLTLCKPGAEIPDHGHPTVDSVVMYVTGEVYFRVEDMEARPNMIEVYRPGIVQETPEGGCSHHGRLLRVQPGQKHGATIGALGGAFITFQRWLNGSPSSVEEDWEGPALDEGHRIKLGRFEAETFEPELKPVAVSHGYGI